MQTSPLQYSSLLYIAFVTFVPVLYPAFVNTVPTYTTEDGHTCWHGWLVTHQDTYPNTNRTDIEQLRWSRAMHYHYAKPSTHVATIDLNKL